MMGDATREEIKKFVEERDAVFAKDDFTAFLRYAANRGMKFPNDEIAICTYHKCRSAIVSLPESLRQSSHQWLIDHNYSSWKD